MLQGQNVASNLAQCGKNAFSGSVVPQQVCGLYAPIESQFSLLGKSAPCLFPTITRCAAADPQSLVFFWTGLQVASFVSVIVPFLIW